MYFLPEQVTRYDHKKLDHNRIFQIPLLITGEASAILFLRNELEKKPLKYPDIYPVFIKETSGWNKFETKLELSELLKQNFIRYDGHGQLPHQIWDWMQQSEETHDLVKGEERENPSNVVTEYAKDLWYTPDPNHTHDIEKMRERNLLKEFEEYKLSKGKHLSVFRLEAVRAGFKNAWERKDYETIILVAQKIPEEILQEDPKLLMWYDQAYTRQGL